MVDKKEMEILLNTYYIIGKNYTIHDTGIVDVLGSVVCVKLPKNKQMPVQFGEVTGDFIINPKVKPVSLKGCPHTVAGTFHVSKNNLITHLEHGPERVGIYVVEEGNPIMNLKGVATHIGRNLNVFVNTLTDLSDMPVNLDFFYAGYNKQMPILRLCMVKRPYLQNATVGMQRIIDQHAGSGKKGALAFAADLIRAGYKDNARW